MTTSLQPGPTFESAGSQQRYDHFYKTLTQFPKKPTKAPATAKAAPELLQTGCHIPFSAQNLYKAHLLWGITSTKTAIDGMLMAKENMAIDTWCSQSISTT